MRLGFSYVGFIYLVMLLVPNLIWAKNKPEDYALYAKNENRILLILERAGEILVSAIVFSLFVLVVVFAVFVCCFVPGSQANRKQKNFSQYVTNVKTIP